MIIRNGKLVLLVQLDVLEMVEAVLERVLKNIGSIYKGTQLVWLTVYNAVKSCFGSGTWLGDKPWLGTYLWKNN